MGLSVTLYSLCPTTTSAVQRYTNSPKTSTDDDALLTANREDLALLCLPLPRAECQYIVSIRVFDPLFAFNTELHSSRLFSFSCQLDFKIYVAE